MTKLVPALLLAVVFGVVGGSFASPPSPERASAHPGIIYCGWGTAHDRYFQILYEFLSITSCDGPADTISVATWAQRWVWDLNSPYLGHWTLWSELPTDWEINYNAREAEAYGLFYPGSYFGALCVRTVAFHTVWHGNWLLGTSAPSSPSAVCF
jgi:hypothetical protein